MILPEIRGSGPEATLREAQARALRAGLAELGQSVTEAQADQLLAFLALLRRWNQAYNLTAVRDPLDMVPRHLLDSLSLSPFLFGDRILDLGTGAGLPGVPLAICHPHRQFWLLDSNGKKIRFLRQVQLQLQLPNVRLCWERMEQHVPEQPYSTIVSRAVASVPRLVELTQAQVQRPGRLLFMKGKHPAEELKGIAALSPRVHALPQLGEPPRHLVEIRFASDRAAETRFSSP